MYRRKDGSPVEVQLKMEAAAQDRTGWREVVCNSLCCIGSNEA